MARIWEWKELGLILVVILVVIVGIIMAVVYGTKSNEGFAGENTTDPDFIVGSSNFTIDANISKTNVFPIGTIIPWHGDINKKPNGWLLCDGTKGTPDLRGRTVIGSGDYEAKLPDSLGGKTEKYLFKYGDKGGEMSHTLSVEEMPSHGHDVYRSNYEWAGDWANGGRFYAITASDVGIDQGGTASYHEGHTPGLPYIEPTGGSKSHNNMQPYVALHYLKFDPDNAN